MNSQSNSRVEPYEEEDSLNIAATESLSSSYHPMQQNSRVEPSGKEEQNNQRNAKERPSSSNQPRQDDNQDSVDFDFQIPKRKQESLGVSLWGQSVDEFTDDSQTLPSEVRPWSLAMSSNINEAEEVQTDNHDLETNLRKSGVDSIDWLNPEEELADNPDNDWIDYQEPNANLPYVTHDKFPELTYKSVVLGLILSALLGAANAYLGLLVGMTISASIPASVLSMATLKLFSRSNILENNIVQTAASAGEALAAGVIFTIPALLILNNRQNGRIESPLKNRTGVFDEYEAWDTFLGSNYAFVTLLSLFGGLLGIAWSIPIRKAMIVEIKPALAFPEGVATACVLKAGEDTNEAIWSLGLGSLVGCLTSLFENMKLWSSSKVEIAWLYKGLYPSLFALKVKSALFGVGYLVGPNTATVIFIASCLQYMVIIPLSHLMNDILASGYPAEGDDPYDLTQAEFDRTKYIGVGMMIIGAAWSLISIHKPLLTSVRVGLKEFSGGIAKSMKMKTSDRQDFDTPFIFVLAIASLSLVSIWLVMSLFNNQWAENIAFVLLVAISSFVFSAVAAYMAGLVGSTNNPVSGVTICNCLLIAGLSVALFGKNDIRAPASTILLCCAVSCACAISSDNMQDLKTGYILGATPWKQQLAMVVGVSSASLTIGPVLEILNDAYAVGDKETLSAPQATLMLDLSIGIMTGDAYWTYIGIGIGYGVLVIAIDVLLEYFKSRFRLPILAFAVGNYLGIDTIAPLFIGGMIHLLNSYQKDGVQKKILYCAGLVAGDALFSVFMAIPIVVTGNEKVIQVIPESSQVLWPIVFPLIWLIVPLFNIKLKKIFRKRS